MTITHDMLEDYHDQALSVDETHRVGEALRRDPALRERLAGIAHLDRLIADSLLSTSDQPAPTRAPISLLTIGAVAASILIGAGLWLALGQSAPSHGPVARAPGPTESIETYQPIRIVLELPARSTPPDPIEHETPVPHDVTLARAPLDTPHAIASGPLIAELESLDFDEQLERCRAWAADPRLRPVVFAHLRRLARDDATAGPVAELAAELARIPELSAWVRSYDLPHPDITPAGRRGSRAGHDATTA